MSYISKKELSKELSFIYKTLDRNPQNYDDFLYDNIVGKLIFNKQDIKLWFVYKKDNYRVYFKDLFTGEKLVCFHTIPPYLFQIHIYNPNNYALQDYQLRIDLANIVNLFKEKLPNVNILDKNSNIIFYTLEKSNGEVTTNKDEWDTNYIWVKIPYIDATSSIDLFGATINDSGLVSEKQIFNTITISNKELDGQGKVTIENTNYVLTPITRVNCSITLYGDWGAAGTYFIGFIEIPGLTEFDGDDFGMINHTTKQTIAYTEGLTGDWCADCRIGTKVKCFFEPGQGIYERNETLEIIISNNLATITLNGISYSEVFDATKRYIFSYGVRGNSLFPRKLTIHTCSLYNIRKYADQELVYTIKTL